MSKTIAKDVRNLSDSEISEKIENLRKELFDLRFKQATSCLLYTSPSPRDVEESRMPSSA